ncbi:hypothetical protein Tco_0766655 [Tanacetum coccineum]
MDWLSKRKFVIVCHEKVVRIPLEGDEILQVHGERTQGVVKTLMNTKVEFRIDLVHGATSVAKSPYRLAPLEMQELSEQLRELQDKVLELLRKEKLYAKKGRVKLRRVRAMSMTIQSSVKDKILATPSETSKDPRVKPRRVRAMAMTIQYGVRGMILTAQSEAFKQENGMMRTVVMDEAHASRSPVLWAEIGESSLIGPELVQETTDKVVLIKEKLKAARDRQKSCADNRRKPLEFEVGERVMLKVSPWKGVIRFGKKGKLAPRYVGPFEILERIGPVAYRLRLPEELSGIEVDKTLRFVEEPVENSDCEVMRLKCSRMVIVKVRFWLEARSLRLQAKWLAVRYLVKVSWNSKCNFELTWVWEDYLKDKYPRFIVWLVKLLVLTYVSVAMNGLCESNLM